MIINLRKLVSDLSKIKIKYYQVRGFLKEIPEFEGGIKYHGFTYHPRFPDEKDPPYEPTKLFMIERIKPMWGRNPEEKRILNRFDINGEIKWKGHINIVKNTPQVNALLWKIKHLIKITPIKFVNGLPEDGNLTGCWLKKNGEFMVSQKLKIEEERIKASYDFKNDLKKLDRDTIKRKLRSDWEGPFSGVIE